MSRPFKAVALLIGSIAVGCVSTGALAEVAHRSDDTSTFQLASASLSSKAAFKTVDEVKGDEVKGFSWQQIGVSALETHMDSLVKVVDVGGQQYMGALREVIDGRIVLEHAALDGGGCTQLALAAIRDIQVFGRAR